jgi:hypothetical protein
MTQPGGREADLGNPAGRMRLLDGRAPWYLDFEGDEARR